MFSHFKLIVLIFFTSFLHIFSRKNELVNYSGKIFSFELITIFTIFVDILDRKKEQFENKIHLENKSFMSMKYLPQLKGRKRSDMLNIKHYSSSGWIAV